MYIVKCRGLVFLGFVCGFFFFDILIGSWVLSGCFGGVSSCEDA